MNVGDSVTKEYALRSATAIYLEVPAAVADDVARVIRSLVEQIESAESSLREAVGIEAVLLQHIDEARTRFFGAYYRSWTDGYACRYCEASSYEAKNLNKPEYHEIGCIHRIAEAAPAAKALLAKVAAQTEALKKLDEKWSGDEWVTDQDEMHAIVRQALTPPTEAATAGQETE